MKINLEGVELIKHFEGLKLEAYQDIGGICTIGYGVTGGIKPGTTITEQMATQLLMERLSHLEVLISEALKSPVTENEFSALICLAYNIGSQALRDSTLLKLLNQGDPIGASSEFLKWIKVDGKVVQGLLNRRRAEQALFLKPTHSQSS